MIDFKLKEDGNSYDLTFMKVVHKRSGIDAIEPGDTLYNISLEDAKHYIAHENACRTLEEDVSLKTYISEFFKSYKEVCELLKKTS